VLVLDPQDFELRALAGVTIPLVDPSFTPDASASKVTDGLDPSKISSPFLASFPYLGVPRHESTSRSWNGGLTAGRSSLRSFQSSVQAATKFGGTLLTRAVSPLSWGARLRRWTGASFSFAANPA
jgi:hypothetical protein